MEGLPVQKTTQVPPPVQPLGPAPVQEPVISETQGPKKKNAIYRVLVITLVVLVTIVSIVVIPRLEPKTEERKTSNFSQVGPPSSQQQPTL